MNSKFDIFISFKATEKGQITRDVAVATDLYNSLKAEGYNVFFSSETMSRGRSGDFSKEIDSALDSAKLLIVVSSKLSYINSRWVEYEWKTFHADILSNIKGDAQIITFTEGINTRELPRILRYVQNYAYTDKDSLMSFINGYMNMEDNSGFYFESPRSSNESAVTGDLGTNHNLYNSAGRGEFEILRVRARQSYAMDRQAIDYVKSQQGKEKYNVLVLGCAYGFVAETRFGLDDDIENVICIDKNDAVLEKAREVYGNYPHMKFYSIDLQTDQYVPGIKAIMEELGIDGFDIIFTSDLFRYLNNPMITIRNTRKLLKRNGMLIVRDCNDANKLAYPDEEGLLKSIVDYSEKAHGMPNFFIGRELPLLIQNGGFTICDIRLDLYNTVNLSYEEKEDFFLSTFGSRKSIAKQIIESGNAPKSDLNKLVEHIDEFENIFFGSNFWYSESNLIFIAKKS